MKQDKNANEPDLFSSVTDNVSEPEKDYTKEIEKFCKERCEYIKELSKRLKLINNAD